MELQKIQKCQSNPEEKGQSSRHNSSRLQTIHKATVIKSVTSAQEQTQRSMEKNRKPRNTPTPYGKLIFGKGGRNIQNENGEKNREKKGEKTFSLAGGVGKARQ